MNKWRFWEVFKRVEEEESLLQRAVEDLAKDTTRHCDSVTRTVDELSGMCAPSKPSRPSPVYAGPERRKVPR